MLRRGYQAARRGTNLRSVLAVGNPLNFAAQGLKLWLRDDAGVVLNGSTVSQWSDQSGAGNHWIQELAAAQPTYGGAGSGLDFDGTDDYLIGPAQIGSLLSASAFTMFVVCTIDSIGTNNGSPHLNDALIADGSGFVGLHLKSVPTAYTYNWDGNADVAETTPTLSARIVMTARHGNGTIGVRQNSAAEATAASGNTTNLTNIAWMGRGAAGDPSCFDGKIYEVVIFNTHLSDANQALVRAYLAARNRVTL